MLNEILKDKEILEQNYIIHKHNSNYYGYSVKDDEHYVCNSSTLGWSKNHLLHKYMSHNYFGASKAKALTLEKDNHDSNFVALVDEIYEMITMILEKKTAMYYCIIPIHDKNMNDVMKAVDYMQYRGFTTILDETDLTISWA